MRLARLFICFFVALLVTLGSAGAASAAPKVTWKARLVPADVRAGETAQVVVEAEMADGWHIYSLTPPEGMGPRPTKVELLEGSALQQDGNPVQPAPHRVFDEGFKTTVEEYGGAVAFGLPVRVDAAAQGAQEATVQVQYQACKEGSCLPPRKEKVTINFEVAPGASRAERTASLTAVPEQPAAYEAPDPSESQPPAVAGSTGDTPSSGADAGMAERIRNAQSQGPLAFVGFAFLMGLLALLTPCVFPMVPITVSYFSKQQEINPGSGLRQAVAYCLGIIGTFTCLGLLMAVIFGAGAIQRLATEPLVNVGLAVLFLVLAANLFGAFEIILPSWMVEKTQAGTQKGGLLAPVLMGLTFTLTSFTCTVAFVGTLLAWATQGNLLWPVLGMLAFSTAFASPFFLLALFPSWLAKMPKSGGWLVTVKAYMGFLEVAAALKFLSNADLVWQLGLLTRPAFLAIWFALLAMAGCFLLGWLRLPHDAGNAIGPLRRGFGVATLGISVFLLAGLNGPFPTGPVLTAMGDLTSGMLPPREYPGRQSDGAHGGLVWHENYDQAVAEAKAQNKPLFIDFTGVTCTNCRVMEDRVFPRPEVVEEFKKFVLVRLYTDKDTPESNRYQKMQEERFGQVTLPLYVVLTPDEEKVGEREFNTDSAAFVQFLQNMHAQAAGATQTAAAR